MSYSLGRVSIGRYTMNPNSSNLAWFAHQQSNLVVTLETMLREFADQSLGDSLRYGQISDSGSKRTK
jgi:hypothetical protein